jgi:hypothetical protein
MRRTTPGFVAVLALLLAAPLAAYTIYFKDGRTVNTKGKPRIVNGLAVVTLQSGTVASFDPADIDQKKTEEMNRQDLGAAVIIEQGRGMPQATPPTQREPQSRLSELAARDVGPRDQPVTRRPAASTGRAAAASIPYGDAAIAAELSQFFLGQKAEAVEILQGSQGRPLAHVTTSSESAVFRALFTSANALLQVRGRHPQKVDGLELVMVMPNGERAGQFTLTPDMAEDLVAKRVTLVSFFLNNVQF